MPRYTQVWFKCDVVTCEARTEELVEVPNGRPVEAALRELVPAGWKSYELHGLVLYDVVVCATCNECLLELFKQRQAASEADRYWAISQQLIMMFPKDRRYPPAQPASQAFTSPSFASTSSLPWAERCERPLSFDGYTSERCVLPAGQTSSCSSVRPPS